MTDDNMKNECFVAVHAAMQAKAERISRSCLGWARETCRHVQAATGQRCIIQAGTAFWPLRPLAEDDDVSPLRYGYQWELKPPYEGHLARTALTGQLPEIHIWAALPDTGEILDFTTGHWPDACKQNIGIDWPPRHVPPLFFWGKGEDLFENAEYTADWEACKFVLALLKLIDFYR